MFFRTKLLELVTKGDQGTSETADHKKGGQIKNKSSLTSNKRRKVTIYKILNAL